MREPRIIDGKKKVFVLIRTAVAGYDGGDWRILE